MSLRERIGIVLGLIGAIALVVYPMAYRITTEQATAAAMDPGIVEPSRTAPATPTSTTARPTIVPTTGVLSLPLEPSWAANAMEHRFDSGAEFEYDCSPNGTFGPVWGSRVYTDDSSVCTAGVHQGVITREQGGTVTIVIRPGRASYNSSTRNGVVTLSWDRWDGSFEIVVPIDPSG